MKGSSARRAMAFSGHMPPAPLRTGSDTNPASEGPWRTWSPVLRSASIANSRIAPARVPESGIVRLGPRKPARDFSNAIAVSGKKPGTTATMSPLGEPRMFLSPRLPRARPADAMRASRRRDRRANASGPAAGRRNPRCPSTLPTCSHRSDDARTPRHRDEDRLTRFSTRPSRRAPLRSRARRVPAAVPDRRWRPGCVSSSRRCRARAPSESRIATAGRSRRR